MLNIIKIFILQKTRFTAYMLWAKEARQQVVEHHPNLGTFEKHNIYAIFNKSLNIIKILL